MTIALVTAMQLVRHLILGGGTVHTITAGRFTRLPNRYRLVDSEEVPAFHRAFEVEPVESVQPDPVAAYVSGNLVDSIAQIVVRVGYLQGGGDGADYASVGDLMAEDAAIIRRTLEEPRNYQGTSSGIIVTDWLRDAFQYATPPDRRAILEQTYQLRLQDDYEVF